MLKQTIWSVVVAFHVVSWAAPAAAQDDVIITEFMALNHSTLADEEGDFPDWAEIHNAGTATVNLNGWYLTDDDTNLKKWQFPAVNLTPGGFLIVFCSGNDRRDPAGRLHTNFELLAAGGFLALVKPDGVTRSWAYEAYPAQSSDYSYGLAQNGSIDRFVESGAPAKALVPSASIGATWQLPSFDDSGWPAGTTGVGFETQSGYESLIGLDVLAAMNNVNTSAYIRVPFTVTDPAGYGTVVARMKYDDGYVLYVNGVRLQAKNAPVLPPWNAAATAGHDDAIAVVFEEESLSLPAGTLRAGTNILGIHGMNQGLNSSDFLIIPELDGIKAGALDRSEALYFAQSSPGSASMDGYPAISQAVQIAPTSRVFPGTLQVTLTKSSPAGVIRYTLDGREPTTSSTQYTGPISLTTSALVRARVFEPGMAPGPLASGGYVALDANVNSFTSNIPVVIVDTLGGSGIPTDPHQPMFMAIFEPGTNGRTSFARAPSLATRGGIKVRGSSTAGDPKKQYAVETWDDKNRDLDTTPFGFPAESDWVLFGNYGFDQALIRNPLMYELSNQVGRYASRTRFCEVYLNTGGGTVAQADYIGVYSFMEKIDREEDRVDVERLPPNYVTTPLVTGGYMLKIDRRDPGDSGFNAAGQGLSYVYPKEDNIPVAQANWIQGYLNQFKAVLDGAGFADPVNGYARYIDPESWYDHHILNVLAKNVDALRLSGYMFKEREERLEMGPIWDFDRSIDSTDGRDDDPRTWNGTGDATRFFEYPWWVRLFQDPEFSLQYEDRWYELRKGPLSSANVSAVINAMKAELTEAAPRNFGRWTTISPGQWPAEIERVRNWLAARSTWIDSQFSVPPTFSASSRQISPGFQLTLTAPQGTIYYTTDGRDPRLRGGGITPGATTYSGPITLNANARVVARSRVSASDWSSVNKETYWTALPRLVVTEILYHPAPPPPPNAFEDEDFEFLELKNTNDVPMQLGGARVDGAIRFTFPAGTVLDPGEVVVLIKDTNAFALRYDTSGMNIAGEYDGRLSNGEETIKIVGPLGEPILEFTYSDAWYPSTDGDGDSLTILDFDAPLSSWIDPLNWNPSSVLHGTPGEDDPGLTGTGGRQRLGDSNQDGILDLSDGVSLLLRLFAGVGSPPCDGASLTDGGNRTLFDVNGDAAVNITDAVHVLAYIFESGPPPAGGERCILIEGCPTACGF
jgi:hypothetical protein